MDIVFVVLGAAFGLLIAAVVLGCERLRGGGA